MKKWTTKQTEYLMHAKRRWNFKIGATRSGKTYLDYYLIPKRIRAVAGKEGIVIMLGNTQATIQRNIIDPLQSIWGAGLVSDIKSNNVCHMFGEKVYCIGADNKKQVDRLRGASIKYCYGDEVVSWAQPVFEMLKSRLDKPYSLFDGTGNPDHPDHFIKKFLDSDADIFAQHYTIFDNTFLDRKVMEEMLKEHKGVFYQRYILGEWTLAQGLIYTNWCVEDFDRWHLHHLADLRWRKIYRKLVGMDLGFSNDPTAIIVSYVDPAKKQWYICQEHHETGMLREAIVKAVREMGCDKDLIVSDNNWPETVAGLRMMGLNIMKTRKNEKVIEGIQKMHSYDMIVHPSCVNTIKALKKHRWKTERHDEDELINVPSNEYKHIPDALRYSRQALDGGMYITS